MQQFTYGLTADRPAYLSPESYSIFFLLLCFQGPKKKPAIEKAEEK
jgi:hypothetical protein